MGNLFHKDLKFIFEKSIPFNNLHKVTGVTDEMLEDYLLILKTAGEYSSDQIAPKAEEVDKIGCKYKDGKVIIPEPMMESLEGLKELGLFAGVTIPEEYGGAGLPFSVFFALGEIFSIADSSIGLTPMLQDGVGQVLLEYANDDIKNQYIPKLVTGERICSMGLTESGAGSDLANMRTSAVKGEDGFYTINGSKIFITNGFGDVLALAKTEEGISMFLVKEEDKKVARIEDKLGIKGSPTCELSFEDSKGELIGELGQGLIPNMHRLMNIARLGVAVQGLGIAQKAHANTIEYAEQRVQFGVPIVEHSPVRKIIYENEISLQASRAMAYLATYYFDMKESLTDKLKSIPKENPEYAIIKKELTYNSRMGEILIPLVKYDTSELCNQITYSSLQLFGGYGFTKEYPMERLYRDARITSIYEGTSQIQVGQVFNESYYFEKIGLINQFKMGNSQEFIETDKNRLFLDNALNNMNDNILKDENFNEDTQRFLNLISNSRKYLKEVREFLFLEEKKRDKKKAKKFHALYHKDYSDIIAYLFKGYCLVEHSMHLDAKKDVTESFINRMTVNVKTIRDNVLNGNDDVVSDSYKKIMYYYYNI